MTCFAGTTGSADSMHIIFYIFRYIIVKYRIYAAYINSSGCHIRSN